MKLGFIGCGNMAGAMLGGILKKHLMEKEDVIASTARAESLKKVKETYGICTTLDNREVA